MLSVGVRFCRLCQRKLPTGHLELEILEHRQLRCGYIHRSDFDFRSMANGIPAVSGDDWGNVLRDTERPLIQKQEFTKGRPGPHTAAGADG